MQGMKVKMLTVSAVKVHLWCRESADVVSSEEIRDKSEEGRNKSYG